MRADLLLERAPRARDSKIVAVTSQDVEPILKRNKLLRSIPQRSDFGRHVYSQLGVPAVAPIRPESGVLSILSAG